MSELNVRKQIDKEICEIFAKYGVEEYHLVYKIASVGLFVRSAASQMMRDHIALEMFAESIAKRQNKGG